MIILRVTVLVLAITLSVGVPISAEEPNAFETLMSRYHQCRMPGAYFDQNTNEAVHPFFHENSLIPYKIENGFAYYRLEASYFGIPVVEIMIPASTWDVRSVTFDIPLSEAQERLEIVLGSNFTPSDKSENGEAPELIEDPKDEKRSIFVCTSPI